MTQGLSQVFIVGQVADYVQLAEGIGYGSRLSTVLAALGALVIFVTVTGVVVAAVRWFRSHLASNSSPPVQILARETRQRVQRAISTGEYLVAADLLARAGESFEAAENYIHGGAYVRAAEVLEEAGVLARAIYCFKRAGRYDQAGRVYEKLEMPRAAAAEYFKAQEWAQAARLYSEANDWRRAAENFERAELPLEAADAFERAGEPLKAARHYASHLNRLQGQSGLISLELSEADKERARRAGELFGEVGELRRASEVFLAAGYAQEAAKALRASGDFSGAADLLIQADQPELAAEFLEEAGEAKKAARMRAEAALGEGDKLSAARFYQEGGKTQKAADLFEEVGAFEEAAELLEELEQYERAMELYIKIGRYAHGARCAEMDGKLARAAEYYQEAGDIDGQLRVLKAQGDFFHAGRLQFEHRMYEDALESLDGIDSRDANYQRSLELQGDIYRAQGRAERAYGRYRAALGQREPGPATIPLIYKIGRALEDEPDLAGAFEAYSQVVAVDPHFEDAEARMRAVRQRLRRGTLTGRTSSGLFGRLDGDGQESGTRYEILEEIARGGMGIVYKARDTVLGRTVAFKILGENLRDNETAVKYFLREARAAAALSHPNIVTIYDAGEQDGEFYMAMEFVDGTTLKDLIRRAGALSDDNVRYILTACSRALNYAHNKGVIHRDIKSGNVMTTRDRALKILDFGLAKFLKEYQDNHTQQVGTPFYMSPEQIIGKDIDFRSDLYSLGCTIFECATGVVPFSKGDLSYHHIHTAPPSPKSLNPGLSDELEAIILRLLEKDPDKRFQSAQELLDILED